jgi:hypothetical protein
MSGTRGRWTRWWVVGAVAAVAAAAALDPSGLRRHVDLAGEVRRMRAENARLAEENAALAREAHALRADPAALERAARAGRDDAPGKPKLYETTEEFLRIFGFASIKELPAIELNDVQEVLENVPID